MLGNIRKFFQFKAASGILLLVAAIAAMILDNSPWAHWYDALLTLPVAVQVGTFEIAKPMLLWINDGLMAVFFLLVGLELKREITVGELRNPADAALPGVAAIGGMLVPALIYAGFNWGNVDAMQGWAIPAATDIAFALGILSLLGDRVPPSLRMFLVTLAIFDDVGAILIIAFFYTANLSVAAMIIASVCVAALAVLNRRQVMSRTPYLVVGLILWAAVLKSGVHATLAGVVLAMFIPVHNPNNPNDSPLRSLEHDLHGTVAFFILPVFGFANAGIPLIGMSPDEILGPIPLGIALGLFLGKQIGVFGFCYVAAKLRLVRLPKELTWPMIYGISMLCGIGFTMSLFIASLAFEGSGANLVINDRVGILMGSVVSGLLGFVVLKQVLKRPRPVAEPTA